MNTPTTRSPAAVRAAAAAHFSDQSAGALDAIQRATDAAKAADQQLNDARAALAGAVKDAKALSEAYQTELDQASKAARAARVLEPSTVLWALGSPVGWLIDGKSKRLPCLTGFRVFEHGEEWDYCQVWVSLEYETLDDVRQALGEASSEGDAHLTQRQAVRTGLVPLSAKAPGRMRIRTSQREAIETAKILLPHCRWATPAEVRRIENTWFAQLRADRAAGVPD